MIETRHRRLRPQSSRLRAGLAVLAVTLALAGCTEMPAAPAARPAAPAPAALPEPAVQPPSPSSAAIRAHYAAIAAQMQAQGRLRTETRPGDAPFTTAQLVENFVRIALYDEYQSSGGSFVARESPARLRRWSAPVRMNIEFGASVPLAQRNADRIMLASTAARLGYVTGHPVSVSATNPNFTVLMLNEDERRAIGPRLAALVPGIDPAAVRAVTNLPDSTYCVVFAFSQGETGVYTRAIAVIRGEHPDILRLSCFHEELAQGMGLANDSPAARPSIFNDDEEFALLTRHDELLLRILYDPRLRPGMAEAEARPIIATIAAAVMGGTS
ncbi:MAG: DUF2927 domain-containing protein [Phaeovulum sp.]|uniref:DUF2927 domain-containing protein n=1 Tax=Phaeovulum sp. TaxID=2934796 RepID=UPI002731C0BB|nr:DUF2927 domain-containing protein [Phaeovulum sp.]MDP2062968.1 DUF2927 domain-containing protein [Phaeovulum sp.]